MKIFIDKFKKEIGSQQVGEVIAGDFNTDRTEIVGYTLKNLGNNMTDAFADNIRSRSGPRGESSAIDHMLSNKIEKFSNQIIGTEKKELAVYQQHPSDHAALFAVYIDQKTDKILFENKTLSEKFKKNIEASYATTNRWFQARRSNHYVDLVKELSDYPLVTECLSLFAENNWDINSQALQQYLSNHKKTLSVQLNQAKQYIENKSDFWVWGSGKIELLDHLQTLESLEKSVLASKPAEEVPLDAKPVLDQPKPVAPKPAEEAALAPEIGQERIEDIVKIANNMKTRDLDNYLSQKKIYEAILKYALENSDWEIKNIDLVQKAKIEKIIANIPKPMASDFKSYIEDNFKAILSYSSKRIGIIDMASLSIRNSSRGGTKR